jgi:hypothetical protein
MASFLHPVLPKVQGDTLAEAHWATLGLITSDASYAMISPATAHEPALWITPQAPGGHQQQQMEQQPKSAPLATFGNRMFRLTGHAPPSSRH